MGMAVPAHHSQREPMAWVAGPVQVELSGKRHIITLAFLT